MLKFTLPLCNYKTVRKITEDLYFMITTMRAPNLTGTDMSSRNVRNQLPNYAAWSITREKESDTWRRKTEVTWDSVIQ